jgi:hypothetical protein
MVVYLFLIFYLFTFYLFILVFRDRVSLYTLGCPGTHFVDQAGFGLRNPPASASWVLGSKVHATTPSYLHFKCYPIFWFLSTNSQSHPPPPSASMRVLPPTTPAYPLWHSPTLGHQAFTGPRASPPIDALQGHPLLHMRLEPWVPPCVLFGWWFSLWELWGNWLIHIVVPSMWPLLSLLQLLYWELCTQANDWLRASTSVFVRHW